MQTGAYITLAIYFLAMFAIGIYSYLVTKNDVTGFMLGGRNLSPSVTALSAGASGMSGWMLLGLPGAIYLSGFGQCLDSRWANYRCLFKLSISRSKVTSVYRAA